MNAPRASLRRVAIVAVSFAIALLGVAATGWADPPAEAPKSVEVEAYVIMASHGKIPHRDAELEEVAETLQGQFGELFNRFRLHAKPKTRVDLGASAAVHLIDVYYLKATYKSAKQDGKLEVNYTLLKRVQVTDDKGRQVNKDTPLASVNYVVPRGLFVLMAGQKVKEETLVLAVRVRK